MAPNSLTARKKEIDQLIDEVLTEHSEEANDTQSSVPIAITTISPEISFVNPPTAMVEYVCPQRANYIANLSFEEFKAIAVLSRQLETNPKAKGRTLVLFDGH